jgi:hypothetical protein
MQNAFPYLFKKKFHMYLQGWYKMKLEQGLTIFFFCLLDNEAHDGIYKKTNYSSC